MSETLETMLEAMPDSYQKTVGFPTYDLLAAAAIPSWSVTSRAGPALCATRPPAHPASSR